MGEASGQYYTLFTAVITPLKAYFTMILTELRRSDVITAVESFITLATELLVKNISNNH